MSEGQDSEPPVRPAEQVPAVRMPPDTAPPFSISSFTQASAVPAEPPLRNTPPTFISPPVTSSVYPGLAVPKPVRPPVDTYKCGVTAEVEAHNDAPPVFTGEMMVTVEYAVTLLLKVADATLTTLWPFIFSVIVAI
jgi:hypothetical protein